MKMNDVSIFIQDKIQDDIWDFTERTGPETDFTPELIKNYVEGLIRSGSLHDDWEDEQDKCLHDIENAQWDLITKNINDMEY